MVEGPLFCVIDLGTTGVRGVVVDVSGTMVSHEYVESPPSIPGPSMVEHDALELARLSTRVALAAIEACPRPGDVAGLGIAVQHATTVVWDVTTGEPVGPAIGWQDLRTLGDCLMLGAQGIRMAPNASGTKVAWLVKSARQQGIPDENLRFGTLETWLAWRLTGGTSHVTDPTNAGVTGMVNFDASDWDSDVVAALDIPESALPEIVPTAGICGTALLGPDDDAALSRQVELPLAALVGDQQSSLIGQGGIRPGVAKTTYGTACMVDVNLGDQPRHLEELSTYPIVAVRTAKATSFGLEATVITGGEVLRGLVQTGIIASPEEASELAASVEDSDGVMLVPAGIGLGTPHWDFGARTTIVGLSLGSGRAHIARAALEGIAARVTECVRAIEAEGDITIDELHVDGGAAASDVLCQAQADLLGIPVLRSAEQEATALGAGLLAGLGTGVLDEDAVAALPRTERTFTPAWDDGRRSEFLARWGRAIDAAKAWVPELSGMKF